MSNLLQVDDRVWIVKNVVTPIVTGINTLAEAVRADVSSKEVTQAPEVPVKAEVDVEPKELSENTEKPAEEKATLKSTVKTRSSKSDKPSSSGKSKPADES